MRDSFTVMDHVPRILDDTQLRLLAFFAKQVIGKFDLRLQRLTSAELFVERDQGITEKVQSERDAELVSERLSQMLDDISDTFFMLDHEWRFMYDIRVGEILGRRPRAELIGNLFGRSIHHYLTRYSSASTNALFQNR